MGQAPIHALLEWVVLEDCLRRVVVGVGGPCFAAKGVVVSDGSAAMRRVPGGRATADRGVPRNRTATYRLPAESEAAIDSSATIGINIADFSAETATIYQPLGIPIPIKNENNGVLTANATVNFLNGSTLYSVTVPANQTTNNANFAALVVLPEPCRPTTSTTVGGSFAKRRRDW